MVIANDVEQAAEAIIAEKLGAFDFADEVSPTDDLSNLERLPKELMWMVIERVPEAVLELRKASATLKSLVEDFAVAQSTMPLVSKITFSAFRIPGSTKKPEVVNVFFDIDQDKVDLFYLRLQLRKQTDFKEEIRKMSEKPDEEILVKKRDQFDIEFDVSDEGCTKKLQQFREYLGRRIGMVKLAGCHEPVTLPYISTVLEHTQFSKMKVVSDKMPEECALHMLQMMVAHNVKELSLAGKFDTTIDTVTLLRQLCSHLRGLQIFQTPMDAGTENVTQSHLFGTDNVDWGKLIVELLSGALDKLNINNPTYSGYLNGSATDKLIDMLPKLNKKVHFVATCDQYSEGLSSDSHKNYTVKVNPPPAPANNNQAPAKPKQFLQIKHAERENEPVVDPFNLEIECK